MEAASESIEPGGAPDLGVSLTERVPAAAERVSSHAASGVAPSGVNPSVGDGATLTPPAGMRLRQAGARVRGRARIGAIGREELLWITVVYMSARLLLLVAAWLQASFGHHVLLNDFANWDGMWYRELANKGYPSAISYGQTTLGFFPMFPLTIWPLQHVFAVVLSQDPLWWSATIAGLVISCVGGLIATVFVYLLAERWWERDTARRATLLFIFFPGAVVFSMVYSEGVLLPLVAACLYFLERRRWLTAGLLAGFATAVQPVALVLPIVCAVSAGIELWRSRWRGWESVRVLCAPLLSVVGAGSFALFLWAWTGNPMANYIAQHRGWQEKTDPLALVHLTTQLAGQLSFDHFNQPTVNLNLVIGLLGAILLVGMLVCVFLARREISPEAIVWTIGVSFLALTSEYVPPNPRMLITAFPALMAVARYVRGRAFEALMWVTGVAFVVLSLLTFVGYTLRP